MQNQDPETLKATRGIFLTTYIDERHRTKG